MLNRYRVQHLYVSALRKVGTGEVLEIYQEVRSVHFNDLIEALEFARKTANSAIYDRQTNQAIEFGSH